ncbi:hypothetical protein L3Q82_000152 [Scortum barcoo]|uniref:Uncharacterized protein n=1 Tax=Scortum barcoo TaxID=214431 RepID=A0ACB8X9B3_9TELE|nr:hypothetical protein L3Q82_000152 [Scortum barcoo]
MLIFLTRKMPMPTPLDPKLFYLLLNLCFSVTAWPHGDNCPSSEWSVMCRPCCEYHLIQCRCPSKGSKVGYTVPCCRNALDQCDPCIIHPGCSLFENCKTCHNGTWRANDDFFVNGKYCTECRQGWSGGDCKTYCRFSLLSLEPDHNCRYDYVEVRDGSDLSSPVIGRFCGDQLPPPIKSSGNLLHILFTSDGYNNFDGFVLTFQENSGRERLYQRLSLSSRYNMHDLLSAGFIPLTLDKQSKEEDADSVELPRGFHPVYTSIEYKCASPLYGHTGSSRLCGKFDNFSPHNFMDTQWPWHAAIYIRSPPDHGASTHGPSGATTSIQQGASEESTFWFLACSGALLTQRSVLVLDILEHPNSNSAPNSSLAVLKLKDKAKISKRVLPVCLPKVQGGEVTVQEAYTARKPSSPQSPCPSVVPGITAVPAVFSSTSGVLSGHEETQGASSTGWQLLGLETFSYEEKNCHQQTHAVQTRIGNFRDWIEKNMK